MAERRQTCPASAGRRRFGAIRRRVLTAMAVVLVAVGLAVGSAVPAAADGFLADSRLKASVASSKRSINLGAKFSTSIDGRIVALQFYRSAKQKKAYAGSLWSSKGKRLGRVTFPKSSKEGWQTVRLAKPVNIKKGTTYVVSYRASDGRYALLRKDFAAKRVAGNITVPKNAGVFRYGKKSVLPKSSGKGKNYLVDVVFEPKAPAPIDPKTTFSIAVIPDTQTEVFSERDGRYANRTQWLVDNRGKFGLSYVLHTGDNVNWGWLMPSQYTIATRAISTLRAAGIPYSLAVGNHDTRAVGWDGVTGSSGYGGSAYVYNPECPQRLGAAACKTTSLVRQTDEFNQAFPLDQVAGVGGGYEAGKVDNIWTTFRAGGTDWLVLTLELWPRKEVLAWAEQVVAQHPKHNVIVQTHHYLDGNGKVSQSNGGYGATAPSELYQRIISKYPNVKLVFSGHTGRFTKRVDTNRGNAVVSYLGNDLGNNYNPVRVLTINTKTGVVTGKLYNPATDSVIAGNDTSDRITITR